MEMILTVVGMIAAFFAGAYVRKPFLMAKKEEAAVQDETVDRERERKLRQVENLLNYNGTKQGTHEISDETEW